MPATPDPVTVITTLLTEMNGKLDKILSAGPAPGPGVVTPPAPAVDETAKFLAKWGPPKASDWPAGFPALPANWENSPNDPKIVFPQVKWDGSVQQAITLARFGYSCQGIKRLSGKAYADARAAINVIANATQATASTLYECGYGLTDPDVCAYFFLGDGGATKEFYQQSFGATQQPRNLAGYTLDQMLEARRTQQGNPGIG